MWLLSQLRWCLERGDDRGKGFCKALGVHLLRGTRTPPALVPEAEVTGVRVC